MSEPSAEPSFAITLTGPDRPGVTSQLCAALAAFDVDIADLEQVVLNGRLTLGVLLVDGTEDRPSTQQPPTPQPPAPRSSALRSPELHATIGRVAAALGLDLHIELGESHTVRRRGRLHVSVLGAPLRPRAMAAIADCIAASGANIDRIERLAAYPVTCVELAVSGADPQELRTTLATVAADLHVDVAVQPAGLARRAKRLVVMDVDSTLIQAEVIELLAAHAGHLDEVAAITDAAMRGEIDFATSLHRRVALLAGLTDDVFDKVAAEIVFTPGARTLVRTLKRLGYQVAIVSGGFTQITDRLVAELGLDHAAANTLEVVDGLLTGRLVGPVIDRAGKAHALRQFAAVSGVPFSQTVAVGDGANDLDMLALAGLGVAFNAKPIVRDAADAALNVPYLDSLLYLLGIAREDVEAADASADGDAAPGPTRAGRER